MDDSKRKLPKLEREEYLAERERLVKAEWDVSFTFVKTMVTLSAGAIGFSFVYIEKFSPKPENTTMVWVAWISLVLSLVFVLISLLTSEKSMECQRDINDALYTEEVNADQKKNTWASATTFFDIGSLVLLVMGLLFLLLFALSNNPC